MLKQCTPEILERYRPHEFLFESNFSRTELAHDTKSYEMVVFKWINPSSDREMEKLPTNQQQKLEQSTLPFYLWRERFILEKLASLEGMVQYHDTVYGPCHPSDSEMPNRQVALVTKWGGDELCFLCAQKDSSWLLAVFRQLCCIVRALHKRKVAHRDLKPENVVVLPNSTRITLIDFATSHHPELELDRQFTGTKSYASPEVLKSAKQSKQHQSAWVPKHKLGFDLFAADIWSLGALFATTLTLSSDIAQKSRMALAKTLQLRDCPGWLTDLILDMTRENPLERPDIHAVTSCFDQYALGGKPAVAPVPKLSRQSPAESTPSDPESEVAVHAR